MPTKTGPRFGWTVALLVIAGVLVLVAAGAAAKVLIEDAAVPVEEFGNPGAGGDADARPRRMYTRQEFRDLVIGKTRAEVAAALGGQHHGVEAGPPEVWHYLSVTVGGETGRPDFEAGVVFEADKATDVRFLATPTRMGKLN
jgi:hypothetical protein